MKFVQRFSYYLVGLVLGCFFVALIFSGKDTRCNYFPNARVLSDIRNKPFHYSENAEKVLSENWVNIADIKNTLEFGDINFDKSDTEFGRNTKIYIIEGKTLKGQEIILKVKNEEGKATLEEILKK